MNLLIDGAKHPDALLVLEDGTSFRGRLCGAEGEVAGPIAFDTNIFGYQRALGEPENAGAILAFTYPQVGNFGINADAPTQAVAAGVVVHDMIYTPSSWQCEKSLPDYLAEQGIVGIEDIDVRALVAHLRGKAPMRATITTAANDVPAKGGETNA